MNNWKTRHQEEIKDIWGKKAAKKALPKRWCQNTEHGVKKHRIRGANRFLCDKCHKSMSKTYNLGDTSPLRFR